MTGLANRRQFLALAAAEWSRFQRYYRPLSVLMIDVDHFKSVNDRDGHAVGDDALIAVANACLEGKRSSDIVGRIGGEEFAMLLPETDLYQARIVAERICKAVAAGTLRAGAVHFKVTASIGFAAATVSMPGLSLTECGRSGAVLGEGASQRIVWSDGRRRRWRSSRLSRAFSSEVDTGSRQENASNKESSRPRSD